GAQGLGRRAMAAGWGTLELARITRQRLFKLVLPGGSPGIREAMIRRAGAFFARAITPIEKAHRTALEAGVQLERLNRTLRRRSGDPAASNRQLKAEG